MSLRSECSSAFLKAQLDISIVFPLSIRPPRLPHISHLFETSLFLLSFCLRVLCKHHVLFPSPLQVVLKGLKSESGALKLSGLFHTQAHGCHLFFSIPLLLSLSIQTHLNLNSKYMD